MAFMAVDNGIVIGDTPRVFFWRGEIATSHQPSECNWRLCVSVSFLLLVRSCRDFVPMNGGPFKVDWKSLHQSILLGSTCWKSSRQARGDWQIVLMTRESWVNVRRGNCLKELEVQFSSSNSSDETERLLKYWARLSSFLNTCRCGVGASGGKVGVRVRFCVQHRAHNLLKHDALLALVCK